MMHIVENYIELKKNLRNLIEKSGFSDTSLASRIGIDKAAFTQRKHQNNWTEEEVKAILSVIENEELEDYFLLELMRAEKNEPRFPVSSLFADLE